MSTHSKIEMKYRQFSRGKKEPIKARDGKIISKRIVVKKCPPSKVKRKIVRDPTASGGKMVAMSKGLGYLGIGVEIEETVAK